MRLGRGFFSTPDVWMLGVSVIFVVMGIIWYIWVDGLTGMVMMGVGLVWGVIGCFFHAMILKAVTEDVKKSAGLDDMFKYMNKHIDEEEEEDDEDEEDEQTGQFTEESFKRKITSPKLAARK